MPGSEEVIPSTVNLLPTFKSPLTVKVPSRTVLLSTVTATSLLVPSTLLTPLSPTISTLNLPATTTSPAVPVSIAASAEKEAVYKSDTNFCASAVIAASTSALAEDFATVTLMEETSILSSSACISSLLGFATAAVASLVTEDPFTPFAMTLINFVFIADGIT